MSYAAAIAPNRPEEIYVPQISCDWRELSTQLLSQWERLTQADLDRTGYRRRDIAELIERKYGVNSVFVENYLRNMERTLPMYSN